MIFRNLERIKENGHRIRKKRIVLRRGKKKNSGKQEIESDLSRLETIRLSLYT